MRVTIGLPVHNGELTLRRALLSIADQTYSNYEVIISDNASSDKTPQIAREAAEADTRIQYFRQQSNVGAAQNFQTVLEMAECDYFMWLGHDDVLEPRFLEESVKCLEDNTDIIACAIAPFARPTRKTISGGYVGYEEKSAHDRILSLVGNLPDKNSRFYALYRLENLLRLDMKSYMNLFAGDWIHIVKILEQGRFRVDYKEGAGYIKSIGGASEKEDFFLTPRPLLWHMVNYTRDFASVLPSEVRKKAKLRLLRIRIGFLRTAIIQLFQKLKRKTADAMNEE